MKEPLYSILCIRMLLASFHVQHIIYIDTAEDIVYDANISFCM